ncbi:condensation domain-containing protein, partial [Nocardiopsis trehalosi]|uniref:condensation domain-containing protein n=1 Tax=Nocardiopsis trehalosi TaxID=109329 RepID=UPI001FE220AA
GRVDEDRFAAALAAAAAETDTLRTRVTEVGGVPHQVVAATGGGDLERRDLRGAADPEGAALAWMRADMGTAVDPLGPRLHRFALLRVADGRYLWYQRFHHIIADAYAITTFTRRVAEVYTRLAEGGPVPGRRFGALADVIADEAAYDASERRAADRAHWARVLADRPEPALLGTAPPAPARAAAAASAAVGADLLDRLTALGAGARATWAEVVVAAFAAYVHRRTGAPDVVLGMPAMGRLGAPALRTPAMVVNILPLRLAVRPADRVGDLVARTTAALRDLRAHQRYRAEDIRRDLALVGRAAGLYGPVVNIKAFDYDLDFAGVRGATRTLSEGPVDDTSLSVYRDPEGGLRLELRGNAARYTAAGLETRLAEFGRVLAGLAPAGADAAADRRVGALDLVADPAGRARSGPDRTPPTGSVGALIAAAAAARPDAVAVRAGG